MNEKIYLDLAVGSSSESFTVSTIYPWNTGEREWVRHFLFNEFIDPRQEYINFLSFINSHRAYHSQCKVFRSYLLIHRIFYDPVSVEGVNIALSVMRDYE
jgi:hypothetical protein